jgi:DNA-binding transcriptional ArsR family regulator
MGDKSQSRRRGKQRGGLTVVIVGLCLIAPSLIHHGFSGLASGGMTLAGLICMGVGLISLGETLWKKRQLPKREIMRLAEQRNGLLTLGEITTALDIDPEIARRTLQALSKAGIASQRWEEFRKNLWEFPDYMTLPITESIELAKARGGRLTLDDLVASGYSRDTARQTLDTLSEKGLAQQDPATTSPALIVTTQ